MKIEFEREIMKDPVKRENFLTTLVLHQLIPSFFMTSCGFLLLMLMTRPEVTPLLKGAGAVFAIVGFGSYMFGWLHFLIALMMLTGNTALVVTSVENK
jgi:hypothetical protein